MNERQFGPVKSGWGVFWSAAPRKETRKRRARRAGPPKRLEGNIDKAIDKSNDIEKSRQGQPYPIRLLKQRYRLSNTYAAFVAAEFRWEGA